MVTGEPRLDGRSWALLLALAILWSLSFIFIKVAGEEIPVFTLVLVRVGIAALALHVFVLATGRQYPGDLRMLLRYGVMGVLNNVLPFALIVYATVSLGAGAASILNATSPIFALLVAHVATDNEKVTPAKLIGILLGLVGVAAMVGPDAIAGVQTELVAAAAMLLASFFYGVAAVFGRSFRAVDATVSATSQLTASTLILLPIALIVDRPWSLPLPSTTVISSALALAILSTSVAYVIFYELIRRAGATNTILVTLLIPVGGMFLGWALLSEPFTPAEAAGMLLIGLGLAVIDGRLFRRLRRPSVSKEPVRPAP
jgi:drug/metabolite transporter (DMT)-like permease